MLLTQHETDRGLLVAVCDTDVVGDTFENEQATLTVDAEFYADDARTADEDAVIEALSRATIANIVGTRAVTIAIEHGIIDEASVLDFDGTRHAQLLRL
ncbi:DUF424 domain-containing protein [Halocatena salina]|uniref:DUF424 family protein n=1 Tax=Halocatena salina TaxID=2934340 RepID=A0A8U0A2J7_9EURY|nr:DUF424 family protein [Halocatena salina]UPM42233.1 DUF424 family protein [Halocatena salina]